MDQKGARGRNRGHDVHMAAGAELFGVTGEAARKPHHVGGADGAGKFLLDVCLGQAGIST